MYRHRITEGTACSSETQQGFTLAEVMIAIAILGILSVIAVPLIWPMLSVAIWPTRGGIAENQYAD